MTAQELRGVPRGSGVIVRAGADAPVADRLFDGRRGVLLSVTPVWGFAEVSVRGFLGNVFLRPEFIEREERP